MPVLRYVVGGGANAQTVLANQGTQFASVLPRDGATLPASRPVEFVWAALPQAAFYRLEVEDDAGKLILSALLQAAALRYRAPSWLKDRAGNRSLHWRVVALDQKGALIGGTPRRVLRLQTVK